MILVAAVMSCGELCTGDAFRQYGLLLAAAKFGSDAVEHGAFLVREPDGRLRLVRWSGGYSRSISYSGRFPAGALAVIHTHPPNTPEPSPHDRREATRIGMPILVLTPLAVTVAWPDGSADALATKGGWHRPRRR